MKRCISLCFCFLLLFTCDDGDVFTVTLDFEGDLERCDNDSDSYLLYDTKDDPSEALTLLIPISDTEDLFENRTDPDSPEELTINGSTIRFNYRSYSRIIGSDELCDVIPPSDLVVTQDYEASSGAIVEITTTVEDDDNDGIPSEDEGRGEMDDNGDFPDAQDSDDDGIPDYLDEDDDNDNVKTILEIDGGDDDDPLTNPLDTDDDGTADYLDEDDDGDGIDTILEDENGNESLTDDFEEASDGSQVPPRYLVFSANDAFDFVGLIDNTYTRTVTTSFIIRNLDLEILNSEELNFGTYVSTLTETTEN